MTAFQIMYFVRYNIILKPTIISLTQFYQLSQQFLLFKFFFENKKCIFEQFSVFQIFKIDTS